MKVDNVVIGMGEVGMAIMRLIAKEYNVIGLDKCTDLSKIEELKNVEYMHVAIPYNEKFVDIVKKYKDLLNPKFIIIYSSVLPGTTEQFGEYAVHSPIEGRHPNLFESVCLFPRFLAGPRAQELHDFFRLLRVRTHFFSDPKITEVGKLLSTTRYGVNLMYADLSNELCKKYGVKYENSIKDYVKMYNEGYTKLQEPRFTQPILTPPEGNIGGHCVINNAKILTKITENPMIELLSKFNNKE